MKYNTELEKLISFYGQKTVNYILDESEIKEFPGNTELIRKGQYVKVVPLVMKGLVKVFTGKGDKELLLYYIQPEQICIMSFSACLKSEKSKIFAITQEETKVILFPGEKLSRLIYDYPEINKLFYNQFDLRYTELVDSLNHLLYDKLDKRLLDYLKEKSLITGKNPLKISHKEIAHELGTVREVVSRLIKKMERQNKVRQHQDSIEIF